MHWLIHLLGLDNLGGGWYGFWSGVGGDASIMAVPAVVLRRHNCHVAWCWRLGRHAVELHPEWVVCRRHHPDDHPTADDVKAAAS